MTPRFNIPLLPSPASLDLAVNGLTRTGTSQLSQLCRTRKQRPKSHLALGAAVGLAMAPLHSLLATLLALLPNSSFDQLRQASPFVPLPLGEDLALNCFACACLRVGMLMYHSYDRASTHILCMYTLQRRFWSNALTNSETPN